MGNSAGLQVRGVVYDVGVAPFPGHPSRPRFDRVAVERDMQVIATQLHCTAVRIVGQDLGRLELAARCAQQYGLAVWLSPLQHDVTGDELLSALAEAARLAERLRADGDVVLVVGWELTMFMRGLVAGAGLAERGQTFSSPWWLMLSTLRHGSFNNRLNAFLSRARTTARQHFSGPLTYAAGMWEQVDWSEFDYVAVDAYRDARSRDRFPGSIAALGRHGKPIVASEIGCATYRGARDRGAQAWTIVDRSSTPPRLDGAYERGEEEQAREIDDVLDILIGTGAAGAFVFTFASWTYPRDPDPALDLDMAAYGLVACRPDGTWQPKSAFTTVARRYAD